MMVMVSNQSGMDIGHTAATYPGALGHLYSPGGQRGPWRYMPYALDNGAWPAHLNDRPWDLDSWRVLLLWAQCSGQQPLWALVPDVVGDRDATLASWDTHEAEVTRRGFRQGFAAQDGMVFGDVPTDDCVIFLGGSTEWKIDAIGPWCARFPGRVHVGRVNTWDRLVLCWRAGAISVDGTGWFRKGRQGQSSQRRDLMKFLKETSE